MIQKTIQQDGKRQYLTKVYLNMKLIEPLGKFSLNR